MYEREPQGPKPEARTAAVRKVGEGALSAGQRTGAPRVLPRGGVIGRTPKRQPRQNFDVMAELAETDASGYLERAVLRLVMNAPEAGVSQVHIIRTLQTPEGASKKDILLTINALVVSEKIHIVRYAPDDSDAWYSLKRRPSLGVV